MILGNKHIVKTNRKEKFWYHNIRGMNYFCYRYWWLVLLGFLLYLFLWYWFCYLMPYKNVCREQQLFAQHVEHINKSLDNCCGCAKAKIDTVSSVLPAPLCPDRVLVFQVCNTNMDRDDNFNVFLNDVNIGQLNLNSNDRVGSVFIASNDKSITLSRPDFTCPMSKMKVYFFDPSIVRFGNNTIKMKNIRQNNNNNQGTVEVRNYLLVGNQLTDPCLVKNVTFEGPTGKSFTHSINYTKCCED